MHTMKLTKNSSLTHSQQTLIDLAASGADRPTKTSNVHLSDCWHRSKRRGHSSEVYRRIAEMRPDWLDAKSTGTTPGRGIVQQQLLERARSGAPRPAHRESEHYQSLHRARAKRSEFYMEILSLRPDWFMPKCKAVSNPKPARQLGPRREELLDRARSGAPTPTPDDPLYQIYIRSRHRHLTGTPNRLWDIISAIRPDWLTDLPRHHLEVKMSRIMELAQSGAPRPSKKDPLYNTIRHVRSQRADLWATILAVRPDWADPMRTGPRAKPVRGPKPEKIKTEKQPKPIRESRTRKSSPVPKATSTPTPKTGAASRGLVDEASLIPARLPVLPPSELLPPNTQTEDQLAAMRRYAGTGRGMLLDAARRGERPPVSGPLGVLWRRSQDPQSWDFDAEFLNLIDSIAPKWR
jgi:hypothetical protein